MTLTSKCECVWLYEVEAGLTSEQGISSKRREATVCTLLNGVCFLTLALSSRRWHKCHKILPTSAVEHLAPVCDTQNIKALNKTADLTRIHNKQIPLPLSTSKWNGLKALSGGSCDGCEKHESVVHSMLFVGGWRALWGLILGQQRTTSSCLRRSSAVGKNGLHHI